MTKESSGEESTGVCGGVRDAAAQNREAQLRAALQSAFS